MAYSLSIIIPVYNESGIINDTIAHLGRLTGGNSVECIVIDGNPNRDTITAIKNKRIITSISGKGRGRQMNRGASMATSNVLLFLHADTLLPSSALEHIESVMKNERYVGGAFDLSISSKKPLLRLVEIVASLRSRITKIPYGDQAIFVRSNFFHSIGGFRDIPIMEDVDFMRRLKAEKGRIHITRMKVQTSPRRWEKDGIVYGTLRNWSLMILYLFGMKPEKLARFYK